MENRASVFKDTLFDVGRLVKQTVEKLIEPVVQAEGLTYLQTMILMGIHKKETVNVSSVSKEFCIGQANASTICKKMENDGFIVRQRDKRDERVVSLTVTEKGLQAINNLKERSADFDKIIQNIPAEKMEAILEGSLAFREVLQDFISNLKENE